MNLTEPLKLQPDLWYAVLCGYPPTKLRGVLSLVGVFNEVIARQFPYTKALYLVVAWQRGVGRFKFRWQMASEDGQLLHRSEIAEIEMYPEGTQFTEPLTITFAGPGGYLVEGFLDDEDAFKTTFRVIAGARSGAGQPEG